MSEQMQQLEFFAVPSPCINVCQVNNRGYCKGCFRSRDERQYWLQLTSAQKRQVIRLCQQRKARVMQVKLVAQLAQQEGEQLDAASEQSSLF